MNPISNDPPPAMALAQSVPTLPETTNLPAETPRAASTGKLWVLALLICAAGLFLRIYPWAGFKGLGFDEALYRDYVLQVERVGVTYYPEICEVFLEDQRRPASITKLPPTRFLYIYSAALWKRLEFGGAPPADAKAPGFAQRDPATLSLHRVSALFTCLWFLAAGVATWRMFGLRVLPPVLALLAFSPTQIHLAQHALIDGVMAFWATLGVWLLWENLRRPNHAGWLAAYGASLGFVVMTKENAFFVFVALCGVMVANRWLRVGEVTRRLLLVSVAGPLAGLAVLIALAGGVQTFVEIYSLLVSKAQTLTYAIKTGDGPWQRYLVDLMVVHPIVLVLALGGMFALPGRQRAYGYLLAFCAFSYLVMCNIRYGMNLRYASIWELPICVFAAGQLTLLASRCGKRENLVLTVAIVAICACDLRQYQRLFVDFGLYELVTEGLLRALKILK